MHLINDNWSHLEITICVCDLVEIQEGLVDSLLELESSLHGIKATAPFVLGWLLDVAEDDAPATLHLELHEFLGMFLLFVGSLLEVLGKARESHVIPVKVVRLCGQKKVMKISSAAKTAQARALAANLP